MKKLIFVFMFMAFSYGCASMRPATDHVIDMSKANEGISRLEQDFNNTVRLLTELHDKSTAEGKPVFTDQEWDVLDGEVRPTFSLLIVKLKGRNSLYVTLDDMKMFWGLAVDAYKKARPILQRKWGMLDRDTKSLLYAFDKEAVSTNEIIQKMLDNPKSEQYDEILSLILKLGKTGLGVMSTTVLPLLL